MTVALNSWSFMWVSLRIRAVLFGVENKAADFSNSIILRYCILGYIGGILGFGVVHGMSYVLLVWALTFCNVI